jgi:hypothetical protein
VPVGEGVVVGVIRTSGAAVPSHTCLTDVSGRGRTGRPCPGLALDSTCGNGLHRTPLETPYPPGGQGVAGSNPVVPTVFMQVRPCLLWRDRA